MKFAAGLLGLSLVAGAPFAHASVISGTFSGTVTSSGPTVQGRDINIDGSPINGSFELTTVSDAVLLDSASNPDTYSYFQPGVPEGTVILTFNIVALDETRTFQGAPGAFTLVDTGTTQKLALDPGYGNPYEIASLELSGPEGSLFDSITDPSTIHGGPGVTIDSLSFRIRFDIFANISVDSVTFTTPVDEPPALAVLVPGVAALLAVLRFKRARRPAWC